MNEVNGRQLLKAVKASTIAGGPVLSVPVGNPVEAILRPVATRAAALNPNDVRVLTEWRNRFVNAFLGEFEANEARTARWLTEAVAVDDSRILFMLDDTTGRTFGYMGLAFIDWEDLSGEADAIVRGLDCTPGLMTRALRTLLSWAGCQLGLKTLGVRVRSDNSALEFYRKFGFAETRRVPLRRTENGDGILWVENESIDSDVSLVHMVLESARGSVPGAVATGSSGESR
jgi:RimJ/RimL family protein N-acetyltransferase